MITRAFIALTALSAPLAMAARPSPGGALSSFAAGEDTTVRQLLTAQVVEGPEEAGGRTRSGTRAQRDDSRRERDDTRDERDDSRDERGNGMTADATTDAGDGSGDCSTITALAETTPELSTLGGAVDEAPMVVEELSDPSEDFTVFAPSDSAFDDIPEEALADLLAQPAALEFILALHIVPGAVMAEDLSDGDVLTTVNGLSLSVTVHDGFVTITPPDDGESVTVTTADVSACNGVVHIVDGVLVPGEGGDAAAGPGADPFSIAGSYGDAEEDIELAPAPDDPEPVEDDPEPVTDDPEPAVVAATTTSTSPEPEPTPEPVEPTPDPEPATTTSSPSDDGGEYSICISGSSETFGPTVAQREYEDQGSAVTITSGGSCSWEEYAGGFDGFPSPKIGDGHEVGMDMAIQQMFPGNSSKQTAFLQAMIEKADPVDLDHPGDEAQADNGVRASNIKKLNNACSALITISC